MKSYDEQIAEQKAEFWEIMQDDLVQNKITGNKPLACSSPLIRVLNGKQFRFHGGYWRSGNRCTVRPSIWPCE